MGAGEPMKRSGIAFSGMAISCFALWLAAWMAFSWPAIQDDALIHLRYAENLVRFHSITYDGVHPNFGTSSLLYVGLLAAATYLIKSPALPRLISNLAHAALFGGLAWLLLTKIPRPSRLVSLLSFTLLALLISPSSIRWLDDGMETGIVLCAISFVAWLAFEESRRSATTRRRFIELTLLGYMLALLRTELAMLAGLASLAIVAEQVAREGEFTLRGCLRALLRSSHLVIGCLLACATILLAMGVLLPDTALAKAEGIEAWRRVLFATAVVLTSSFAIGAGLALFWLVTLGIVVLRRRLSASTVVVNLVFPVLLSLSMLRGQDIQGVRYLLWALLFPSIWNILTLGLREDEASADGAVEDSTVDIVMGRAAFVRRGVDEGTRFEMGLVYAFVVLLFLELPFESRMMYHVLRSRAATMREFNGQHLERLAGLQGVSMDIGYIGYFTHARICDMSGLVNGRAVARMKTPDRVRRCAEEHPEFAFGNSDQLGALTSYLAMGGWRVCSGYDFRNLRKADMHYLVAPPATADRVCRSTGVAPEATETIDALLHRTDLPAAGAVSLLPVAGQPRR